MSSGMRRGAIIWLVSANLDRGSRAFSGAIGDHNVMPASAILFPTDPCRL